MATTKKLPAAAETAPAETEAESTAMVQLKCDKLGVESRDFTPKHANDLLAFQEAKGLNDWQRVDAAASTEQA